MLSIKINEVIENHDVVIPFDRIKALNHQKVEILIISKELSTSKPVVMKNALSKLFDRYSGLKAFAEIDDPVTWQQRQRDEW